MKLYNIIIIDFGSQYTTLITKHIEKLGIRVIVCHEEDFSKNINEFTRGIILSGGPQSVNEIKDFNSYNSIFNANLPILGICYGLQLISKYYGGVVESSLQREFGKSHIQIEYASKLFDDIDFKKYNQVWMSHSDNVAKVPYGFKIIATSNKIIAAINKNKIYGVQFHPEVNHTQMGGEILKNFITKICNISISSEYKNVIEEKITNIKKTIGKEKVLLALSGGVDSLITSVLINKAIGNQLHCFFIDNGLNRKLEALETIEYLKNNFKMDIEIIEAKQLFLNGLRGIEEPEAKRKMIGKLFIDIFEKLTINNKKYKFLAQGTILSDVIESSHSSKVSKVIKSHHNVGGLPENMKLEVIEPLKDLFKNEVRQLGKILGIQDEYINRQPVPGPGFAIRILGEVNEHNLNILTKADEILIKELKKTNLYYDASQTFVVFLPIKSVGVMGDYRTYENVIAIRSVETTDFMTAKFSKLPWEFLEMISTKIINEVEGINRVVYDITTKPPATIEWE